MDKHLHPLSTHLHRSKTATILADGIFKYVFLNENDRIPMKMSLKCFTKCPVDNKPALIQVMAWRRTGDKPLHKPMMAQVTNAYIRHKGDELMRDINKGMYGYVYYIIHVVEMHLLIHAIISVLFSSLGFVSHTCP